MRGVAHRSAAGGYFHRHSSPANIPPVPPSSTALTCTPTAQGPYRTRPRMSSYGSHHSSRCVRQNVKGRRHNKKHSQDACNVTLFAKASTKSTCKNIVLQLFCTSLEFNRPGTPAKSTATLKWARPNAGQVLKTSRMT